MPLHRSLNRNVLGSVYAGALLTCALFLVGSLANQASAQTRALGVRGRLAVHSVAARRGQSWMSPQARTGSHLIYWGDAINGDVEIFPSKGKNQSPIGKISGGDLQSPNRLFVDKALNLYVADGGTSTILIYPPGAASPSLTISDGVFAPVGLAVDSSGTIYCANIAYHTVTEYPAGQTSPSLTINLPVYPANLALDSQRNLYVVYNGGSRGNGVMRFRHGSTTGKDLDLDVSGASAVEIDHAGNLIVANGDPAAIEIFPPGATEPSKTIALRTGSPFDLALNKAQTVLYVTVGLPSYQYAVMTLKYPDGTALKNKITQQLGQFPIAVSPDSVR